MDATDREKEVAFQKEADHLSKILAWLDQEIQRLQVELDALGDRELEVKALSWDDRLDMKNSANTADNAVAQEDLRQIFGRRQALKKQLAEYQMLKNRPYFGKLTFSYQDETKEEAEEYYIGLRSLYDSAEVESLVVDWRSPLASLYYDAEPGPVTIAGPQGPIQGHLWQKQMLTISKGRLLKVADFDQSSSDDLLRDILSQASAPELKEIAASLQKGQNALIRLPDHQSMLAWGVAGSGKSSVAVHRAAWLLYRQRFSAKRILFISPSKLFAEYVSLALPALGEESLALATFVDLAKDQLAILAPKLASYDYAEASPERLSLATGPLLSQLLATYGQNLATRVSVPADLAHSLEGDQVEAPTWQDDLDAYLDQEARDQESSWGAEEEDRPNMDSSKPLRLKANLVSGASVDLDQAYKDFLASDAVQSQLPGLYEKAIFRRYDRLDLSILARLSLYLGPKPNRKPYYFLIVDESQDLLPLEHEFLAESFPCPTNLFGDPSQAIRFSLPEDYTTCLQAIYKIKPSYVFALKTSYRSTYEIMTFARQIIQDPDLLPFARHGQPVQLSQVVSEAWREKSQRILADFYRRGGRRLAVICRDLEECQARAAELLGQDPASYITEEGSYEISWPHFPWPELLEDEKSQDPLDLYILPVRQTKGLEFDAVLVADASCARYQAPEDSHLLYLASTRALHELQLLYTGPASRLIPPDFLKEDE